MTRLLRQRWRWVGVVAAGLIASVAVASGWWGAALGRSTTAGAYSVGIGRGCIGLYHTDPWPEPSFLHGFRQVTDSPGWYWIPYVINEPGWFGPVIPLWIPLVIIAAPTLRFWYRDSRRPPGACQCCGYDLSGTPSGVCPECGAKQQAEETRASSA